MQISPAQIDVPFSSVRYCMAYLCSIFQSLRFPSRNDSIWAFMNESPNRTTQFCMWDVRVLFCFFLRTYRRNDLAHPELKSRCPPVLLSSVCLGALRTARSASGELWNEEIAWEPTTHTCLVYFSSFPGFVAENYRYIQRTLWDVQKSPLTKVLGSWLHTWRECACRCRSQSSQDLLSNRSWTRHVLPLALTLFGSTWKKLKVVALFLHFFNGISLRMCPQDFTSFSRWKSASTSSLVRQVVFWNHLQQMSSLPHETDSCLVKMATPTAPAEGPDNQKSPNAMLFFAHLKETCLQIKSNCTVLPWCTAAFVSACRDVEQLPRRSNRLPCSLRWSTRHPPPATSKTIPDWKNMTKCACMTSLYVQQRCTHPVLRLVPKDTCAVIPFGFTHLGMFCGQILSLVHLFYAVSGSHTVSSIFPRGWLPLVLMLSQFEKYKKRPVFQEWPFSWVPVNSFRWTGVRPQQCKHHHYHDYSYNKYPSHCFLTNCDQLSSVYSRRLFTNRNRPLPSATLVFDPRYCLWICSSCLHLKLNFLLRPVVRGVARVVFG